MVWCSNCAKNYDPTFHDGFLCCPVCGRVIDQDNFSSEPTFVKNAAGQSLLAGNFVRTVQSDYSASRERILKTAYDNMNNLVRFFAMDDGDMLLQPAVAFYTIALERNFTRGRRRELVEAACLYIACRENKKPFLLIDFSDYLKENVYVLGSTFLQLCKLLSLEEHPIVQKPVDPSLFMHRFASRLLGDGYLVVSKTAVRIIASMKRDWMQTGRKPSGLCGAALYVAALSHGIKCSKSDIVKIVHICEATLTKRLVEFENTKSGSLTIEEFNKKAQELEVLAKQANIVSKVNSTNELLCEHKGTGIAPFAHGLCEPCYRDFLDLSGGLEGDTEPPAFQHAERERMTKECTEENAKSSCFVTVPSQGQENSEQELETVAAIGNKKLQFTEAGKDGASTNHIDEVCFDKFHGVDGKNNKDNDESDNFSDIDDSEVEGYLHNEEEKYYKKKLWEEMNWEYIEEQAAKEAAAAAAKKAYEASFSNCPEEMQAAQELAAAAAAAVAKSRKEKQQKRAAEAKNSAPAKTAVEATRQMLMKKRLSSKINYDALDKLFDDSVDAQNFKKSRIDSQSDIDEYQPHINKDNKSKISYKDGELAQDDEYDEVGGKVEQEYDENLDYGHVEGGYAYDDNYGYDEY